MEGMQKNTIDEPYLKRLSAHLRTINEHRYQVMKNCFACGLYRQGLTHDLSKYSFSEFHESVKYFQGTRSPYAYEKEHFGYAEFDLKEVEAAVIINESVELAKKYCDEDTYKLINRILDVI